MVFNPPALRLAPGEEPPDLPTVTITQTREKDAYLDQAIRAAIWISVLVIGWLLTILTCSYKFPPECDLPNSPEEALTDLVTLLLFGFTQVRLVETAHYSGRTRATPFEPHESRA